MNKFDDSLFVVLASGSPRRSELLAKLVDEFFVMRPSCDEMSRESEPPKIVMDLARQKADAVVAQLLAGEKVIRHSDGAEVLLFGESESSRAGEFEESLHAVGPKESLHAGPRIILIASDTLVVHDGKILGKPQDETDAAKMLSSLQNDWHSVYTGVCIYELKVRKADRPRSDTSCFCLVPRKSDIFCDRTDVHMVGLTSEEIKRYIAGGSPMDKAGAYGIQDMDGKLVDKIRGLHDTVMGFPTEVVKHKLVDIIPKI